MFYIHTECYNSLVEAVSSDLSSSCIWVPNSFQTVNKVSARAQLNSITQEGSSVKVWFLLNMFSMEQHLP